MNTRNSLGHYDEEYLKSLLYLDEILYFQMDKYQSLGEFDD